MTRHFFSDRAIDEAASLRAVAAGNLPLRAVRRIEESRAQGHALFTSTLSPAESVVARKVGLRPLSQVMGSSMFHVTLPRVAFNERPHELEGVQKAFEAARIRALSRMQQEAALLGADIVIDVRFEGGGPSFAQNAGELLIEMTAVGTAARIAGEHAPPEAPVLTLLRADEYAKLLVAGFRPLGISFGGAFWYERHADCEGGAGARELTATTRAMESAYALAVARFEKWTDAYGAAGVVGVNVFRRAKRSFWKETNFGEQPQHMELALELALMGTAVARLAGAKPPPQPLLVVDLRDKRAAPSPALQDTQNENTAGGASEGGAPE